MYLLKSGTHEFNKILASSYNIDEQPNLVAKKQFVNGNRKKITTSYTDCVITINLGGLDNTDIASYLDNLVDGEYEYWSVVDQAYNSANFIVTLPSLVIERAYASDNFTLEDLVVILEKSSDIEVVSV